MEKIYTYNDYRKYLKDYYNHHKTKTNYFSFRYFSQRAGFGSPSYLKFVINGDRNLKPESVEKFVTALNLTGKEAAYFRTLVNFNQAGTEALKNKYFKELIACSAGTNFKKLDDKQYEFYSKWYHSAIRELVTLSDFQEDPAWIARRLRPPIRTTDVKKSLKLLKELGLIKYNSGHRLVQSDPVITTGDEVVSLSVRNFHRQMIGLAAEAIERIPREKREISSITVGISQKSLESIKARITAFEDELLETIEKDQDKSCSIYQLNFQFFPLADTTEEKA
jgi:uncharacterized protein (TIGR02147 family)